MNTYTEIENIDASTYAGKAALAVKTKLRGVMGEDLLTLKLIDFVSFIMLSNKFSSKGIFITAENKEESYIKIIETGDESLINDLEKYLVLMDEMKALEAKKAEYFGIIKQLQTLHDKEDTESVNKIVEEYLRR